jgi:Family of unknown function (DUF6283)
MSSRKPWSLNRTVQCAKCPWRKDVNPHDIPNGYSAEKHAALKSTIAKPADVTAIFAPAIHVMACHEAHKDYCIGWLANQLGDGNNIALRLKMRNCENVREIRTVGKQHERFEETLPK